MVCALGIHFELTISIDLLQQHLFHADGVHNQFEMLEDFRLMPLDVAVDRFVGQ